MAAVIALRPETERGREILDDLENRHDKWPMNVLSDGTRRYQVDAPEADVDAFDPMLDDIDSDWRRHVSRAEFPRPPM
jgi:hypothetical protein